MNKFLNIFNKGVRDIIFGTQDGLVSTLGVLTGIAQGTQNRDIVILSGFVIVIVESLSMAAGSYLSSKSHRQYQEHLLSKEKDEIENNIEHEEEEILEMYKSRGYKDEEIEIIKKRLLSDRDLLLEDMAHKELGIVPKKFENPGANATFMGFSYLVGGSFPVVPYLILDTLPMAMIFSFLATATALFGMGGLKGYVYKVGWIKSGLEMLLVAGSATVVGYMVGYLLNHLDTINKFW